MVCALRGFMAPPFAMLLRGDLRWNRFAVEVKDINEMADKLEKAGVRFRNEVVTGVGGKQVIIEDPSGNPVELFEPVLEAARMGSKG